MEEIDERLAFPEFEHDRLRVAGVLESVNAADVGLIERSEDPRLAAEAADPIGIV